MTTTTIFRIEHPADGGGPYQRDDGMQVISRSTVEDKKHPTVHSDPKLHANLAEMGISDFAIDWQGAIERYSFGFVSAEQLKAWFKPKWLEGLATNGYVVAVCHVQEPRVIPGDFQCLFIRPHKYERISIAEFLASY